MTAVSFAEEEFRRRVDAALKDGQALLQNARTPHYLVDEHSAPHTWVDGFELVTTLSNVLIRGSLKTLERLGLPQQQLLTLLRWSDTNTVTLRFQAKETCQFLRTTEREVESSVKHVTKNTVVGTSTSYSTTKVTEHFWSFRVDCAIVAFPGVVEKNGVVLTSHCHTSEIATTVKKSPHPELQLCPPIDADISFLLREVDDSFDVGFYLDRTAPTCRTPRRNAEVSAFVQWTQKLAAWCARVNRYLQQKGITVSDAALHQRIEDSPALPSLLETGASRSVTHPHSRAVAANPDLCFMIVLLAERIMSLDSLLKEISTDPPQSLALRKMAITLAHFALLCTSFVAAIDHVEIALERQLIAAIGRRISPADVAAYMHFHYRKQYAPQYHPRGLCYSVRRPACVPEGVIAIEEAMTGSDPAPIVTFVSRLAADEPITFALNAAAKVTMSTRTAIPSDHTLTAPCRCGAVSTRLAPADLCLRSRCHICTHCARSTIQQLCAPGRSHHRCQRVRADVQPIGAKRRRSLDSAESVSGAKCAGVQGCCAVALVGAAALR